MERMQKRAERFGTNVAPSLTAVEENEKKQKRRERFGLATSDLPEEVKYHAALFTTYLQIALFFRKGSERDWSGLEPANCTLYYSQIKHIMLRNNLVFQ